LISLWLYDETKWLFRLVLVTKIEARRYMKIDVGRLIKELMGAKQKEIAFIGGKRK